MAISAHLSEGKGRRLTDAELSERLRWRESDADALDAVIDEPKRGSTTRLLALKLKALYGHAAPAGKTKTPPSKRPKAYVVQPPDGERVSKVTQREDGSIQVETVPAPPGSEAAPAEPEAKVTTGESRPHNLGHKRPKRT